MLRLKFLTGPEAGKATSLKPGENIVGRLPECDISIPSPGVSKRHAKITVQESQCVVTDLGSSNGTFVNGSRIKDRILRPGDRIAFNDIIVELATVARPATSSKGRGSMAPQQGFPNMNPMAGGQPWGANIAYQQQQPYAPVPHGAPQGMMGHVHDDKSISQPHNIAGLLKTYVEKVILPGIYKIVEFYPLKNVIGLFIAAFVILVTVLSTIPMIETSKDGIQKEARRRAVTIARNLASVSEKLIAQGNESGIRTDFSEAEDGVTLALVVAKEDGHIIAPLSKAQSYSNEEFVARARKHDEVFVQQINDTTVGASVPIKNFSSEMGQQVTIAFAQIIYKMDSFDWNAAVGVFARILLIAILLSFALYYILYKIVTEPIRQTSRQLDAALRGEKDIIKSKYLFDALETLIDNINSALGRIGQSKGPQVSIDRSAEATNLVRMVSDAAFCLDGNNVFLQVNGPFEELIGMRQLTLQGQTLEIMQDQALKLNLEDVINRAKTQPGSVLTSQIDISGIAHEIDVQASAEGESIAYVFGTIKKGAPY